ncbi:outer membrane protein assembly factor BamD [Herbaspirillum rubrisubalbicans]|jgi:outer membrane protein assembly factor BamD|uniref:Outer membrane protein assembly factor BamD n=1 Tax=Herbaspirillum rubrisubalbicans Os34 TaxID=1235827 RepID=A0A6M3ZTE3_9BURK|nr:outer membrane protein assembly factor BamD [Herbaspirillum rubrisubalbicans]NQE47679.1 competence protein ComL [Herbaspirillum rubrisubalbicans]QJQ01858.1 outer membrane protein assembly factor BamD [Herbaspirillum rubrisubalbicans Os34]
MHKILLKFFIIGFALSLTACGLLPEQKDETVGWSAAKLYSEAKDELNAGGYDKAIKYFEKLESRYPFGTYAQQAQMDIAYAYYRQNEQAQGLAAVDRFIKLHPNHPNVDYMYYLRGLINFNDRTSIFDTFTDQDNTERDPKAMRDAFDSFKLLAERFPESKYTPDAIARMKYLVNAMAQYDVHVASYYYRRGAYVSAANRAQAAIKQYPDSPANEEALFILMHSYEALGQTKLKEDTERIIQATYPNSPWYHGGPKKKDNPWWKLW